MRYYSVNRPIGPGTYPADRKPDSIINFDDKKYCQEIQGLGWGYMNYSEPLTDQQVKDYELVPAGLKNWFCVVTTVYDDGRVTSNLVDVVQRCTKPENTVHNGKRSDVYIDYFATGVEAEKYIQDARNA